MNMRVKKKGKKHQSSLWKAAVPLYWYPATEQLWDAKRNEKVSVKYTTQMRDWLLDLQRYAVNSDKAIEIFDIAQGLFNKGANSAYMVNRWPKRNRIPLSGPLKPMPIAEGITSDGNLVNVLRSKGKWATIECIDPKKPLPLHITPLSHPHLFCIFTAVQVGTGKYAYAVGGAVFPLFADYGWARMHVEDLEKA